MQAEALALQFGGAAGTLAALGPDGAKVRSVLAAKPRAEGSADHLAVGARPRV